MTGQDLHAAEFSFLQETIQHITGPAAGREIMEIIIQRNGNMPFLKPFPHFRTVKNIQCRQHESALPPECGGQFFCSQRITDITLSAAGGQQFASGIRQFFIQRHPSAGTGCGNGGKQSGRTTADNSNI